MSGEVTLEIVALKTNEVVETIPCSSARSAEKVERGILINLDHDNYFVREQA